MSFVFIFTDTSYKQALQKHRDISARCTKPKRKYNPFSGIAEKYMTFPLPQTTTTVQEDGIILSAPLRAPALGSLGRSEQHSSPSKHLHSQSSSAGAWIYIFVFCISTSTLVCERWICLTIVWTPVCFWPPNVMWPWAPQAMRHFK